jgi:hypothetical protein
MLLLLIYTINEDLQMDIYKQEIHKIADHKLYVLNYVLMMEFHIHLFDLLFHFLVHIDKLDDNFQKKRKNLILNFEKIRLLRNKKKNL